MQPPRPRQVINHFGGRQSRQTPAMGEAHRQRQNKDGRNHAQTAENKMAASRTTSAHRNPPASATDQVSHPALQSVPKSTRPGYSTLVLEPPADPMEIGRTSWLPTFLS